VDTIRLLVVSDVHSNITALETVLDDAGDFDHLICVGDIVGYGPDPGECVEKLRGLGAKSVTGNHDLGVVTEGPPFQFNVNAAAAVNINRRLLTPGQLGWLRRLPKTLKFKIEGVNVSVFHGSPSQPVREYIFPSEARLRASEFLEATGVDLLILGHTHIPFVHRFSGRFLTNPGAVGQPRDGDPRASYLTIDLTDGEITAKNHRVEYDIFVTEERMKAKGLPAGLYRRLHIGR
jgi:putative phosphoesterase